MLVRPLLWRRDTSVLKPVAEGVQKWADWMHSVYELRNLEGRP